MESHGRERKEEMGGGVICHEKEEERSGSVFGGANGRLSRKTRIRRFKSKNVKGASTLFKHRATTNTRHLI